jgi:hypothetical protein
LSFETPRRILLKREQERERERGSSLPENRGAITFDSRCCQPTMRHAIGQERERERERGRGGGRGERGQKADECAYLRRRVLLFFRERATALTRTS